MINAKRVVEDLKELRALTSVDGGAQRVAWTDTWLKSRKWFREKLSEMPTVEVYEDAAGNCRAIVDADDIRWLKTRLAE